MFQTRRGEFSGRQDSTSAPPKPVPDIHKQQINVLTLKIQGDYAESAWGIKEINHEIIGNTIVLTGTLVSEGKGAFEYSVNVPPDVDIVKINDRILWTRPEAM